MRCLLRSYYYFFVKDLNRGLESYYDFEYKIDRVLKTVSWNAYLI